MKDKIKVLIGLPDRDLTKKDILRMLQLDPYQTIVSRYPIYLTHPRTGKRRVMSEFVDELLGDSRFAIEIGEEFIFISRTRNSALGSVFLPTFITSKKVLDNQ